MKGGGEGGKWALRALSIHLPLLQKECGGTAVLVGLLKGVIIVAQLEMMRKLKQFMCKEVIYFYTEISITVCLN